MPRLFGNTNNNCVPNSSLKINGCGKLNDITEEILIDIKDLGVTHIYITGLIRHAKLTDYSNNGIAPDSHQIVKGIAGSPYSIKDYYDIDPDLAIDVENRDNEFDNLIERCHKIGLKLIIDLIPNHLSRAYKSLRKPKEYSEFGENDNSSVFFDSNNNFYYLSGDLILPNNNSTNQYGFYENPCKATGNNCFVNSPSNNDWYETVKLNYGINYIDDTRNFDPIPKTWKMILEVAKYWASKNIDGFRVDMAEMVPIEFWEWFTPLLKLNNSNLLLIAEIYKPELYSEFIERGQFDLLYDKVGLYDTLKGVSRGEISAASITSTWQSLGLYQDKMLNFLENHDEVRIASDFFLGDSRKAIPSLVVSTLFNRAPFMLYFGQELGERGMDSEGFSGLDGKTTIFDYWSLRSVSEWINKTNTPEIRDVYKRILNIAQNEKAIHLGKTFDLMYINPESDFFSKYSNFVFMRHFENELILVVVNFSDSDRIIKINIPFQAFEYFEIPYYNIYRGINLFTGNTFTQQLTPDKQFETSLKSYGAAILKFQLD